MRVWCLLAVASVVLVFCVPAKADVVPPPSACTLNAFGGGFTCHLFESDNGEFSNTLHLPSSVTPGFVILMDFGDPQSSIDTENQATWSDVAIFTTNVDNQSFVQFVSDGSGLFPSVNTVLGASHTFLLETPSGQGNDDADITVYIAGPNTYNFHSDSPSNETGDVPEPATMSLMGAGLLGLGLAAKKLRK